MGWFIIALTKYTRRTDACDYVYPIDLRSNYEYDVDSTTAVDSGVVLDPPEVAGGLHNLTLALPKSHPPHIINMYASDQRTRGWSATTICQDVLDGS